MKFTIAIAAICAMSQAEDILVPSGVAKCDVDETQGPRGWHTCDYDSQCAGNRYCSNWGWCHGTDDCWISIDPVEALQAEVDGLEQSILDLTNEVQGMRDAFTQVTHIMKGEFDSN